MVEHRFRRNTRQRKVILEELRKLHSHPTAVGLYEIVRHRLPKISLGTVYRNLELLVEMGAVEKLDFGAAEARFDGNTDHHDHVRCVKCGRVADIEGRPLDLSLDTGHDCAGFEILGHRLQFVGICPQCKRASIPEDSGEGHSPCPPEEP